jgi:hypothetical protein
MDTEQHQKVIAPDQLHDVLLESPAYCSLSGPQQSELSDSMAKVFNYLSTVQEAPARQLAPDLDTLRRGVGRSGGGYADRQTNVNTSPTPAPQSPSGRRGPGTVDRAAGAAAAMLGAIDFPGFVASLVQGTFQAIVDASIQQMEAYASLLQEVAKTVDDFMADNVTDDMARDHLVDTYGDVFQRDLASGRPELQVDQNTLKAGELPTFLSDLGFDSPMDIDENAIETVIVPETQRTLAEMRHQTLATMVMMGINRVVVDDGEINAKLIFHVDATESMSMTFDENKPTNWTLAGRLGRNAFGASGIMVQTTNLNAQSDLNVRADLTGEVRIRFRSETFPLERFADSAAIQLINTRARVPEPRPKVKEEGGKANGAEMNASAREQSAQPFSQVRAQAQSQSGNNMTADPWLTKSKT